MIIGVIIVATIIFMTILLNISRTPRHDGSDNDRLRHMTQAEIDKRRR